VVSCTLLGLAASHDHQGSGYVRIKNISLGGILFASFEPLQSGAKIQLKLRVDPRCIPSDEFVLTAEVLRCARASYNERTAQLWDVAAVINEAREPAPSHPFSSWLDERDEEAFNLF